MSVNNPVKTRRKYDASFKQDVLQMVASGRAVSELAQALGVSASQIHRWIHQSRALTDPSATSDASQRSAGSSNPAAEFERLKADLRRTEMERDILKKALAIFSRTT